MPNVMRRSANAAPPGRRRTWLYLLVLVALTLTVYGRAVRYGFLSWDDGIHVTANRGLRPAAWSSWRDFWRRPYQGLYIPATYSSYCLDAWLCQGPWTAEPGGAQLSPTVFHAGNLVWHVVNVMLVFALARLLVGADVPALLAAALFAVHPLAVESVVWVSERKGVLCGAFALVATWLYFRARGADTVPVAPRARPPRRSRVWLWIAATVAFVLAMLAKPLAAAWPLSVAALEFAFFGRWRRAGLFVLSAWLVVVAFLAYVTKDVQPDAGIEFKTPLADRPLVALHAVAHYVSKLLAPVGLVADYGYRPQWLTAQTWFPWLWLAVVFAAVLAVVGIVLCVRHPQWTGLRMFVGTSLAFVVALAPVSGIVLFEFQDISTVADRYAYLALVAPALGVAWLVARRPGFILPATLVVVLLSAMSWVQVGYWRNDEALWKHNLEFHEESYLALRGLGAIYAAQGDTDRALEHLLKSYRIQPSLNLANNLAWIYATNAVDRHRNGQLALTLAREVTAPPHDSDPATLDTLAAAQAECGQFIEAVRTAERAVALARSAGAAGLADQIAGRAALYRDGKPYREQATYALPGTE